MIRPLSTSTHFSRSMRANDDCLVKVNGELTDQHLAMFKRKFNKSGVLGVLKSIKSGAMTRSEKRKRKDAIAKGRNKRRQQRRSQYR